jgi:hypothetical protein
MTVSIDEEGQRVAWCARCSAAVFRVANKGENTSYVERIEREVHDFRSLFRRNRPVAIAILVLGIAYVGYKVFKPSDDLTRGVMQQAEDYRALVKEHRTLEAELSRRKDEESALRIKQLEEELAKMRRELDASMRWSETVTLGPGRESREESGLVVSAWTQCVDRAPDSTACDAILRLGLFASIFRP